MGLLFNNREIDKNLKKSKVQNFTIKNFKIEILKKFQKFQKVKNFLSR